MIPPVPPVSGPHGGVRAPLLPNAPKTFHFEFKDSGRELPRFTEKAKGVPTVELLHRIAQTAGWSVTIVGSPKEPVDIDVKDADPREALKSVLKQSGALGVLKNTKLVVVATSDSAGAGTLIERTDSRKTLVMPGQPGHTTSRRHHSGNDMVKVMQGDLTVPPGQVVLGDVVCVGGSIELSPGSVVQGDAVAVG